ncbi:hypothetical protein GGR52DRAFT_550846 [Hypoxylon sp. FL1284]|nr:hypothetical protein GGR52DRAFT_550846 [Hypoxylon sp. FL1284]
MRSLLRAVLPRGCGSKAVKPAVTSLATSRTFSSLPNLRPTVLASSSNTTTSTVFRSHNLLSAHTPTPTSTGAVLDLVPKSSVSAHPAIWGPAQVRFGPRPTLARTSRMVRKRRHGFLSRVRTHNGRKILQRRRDKKRSRLSN